MKLQKLTFRVTKTCNNGNEKTQTISVYAPYYVGNIRNDEDMCIEKAIDTLMKKHYYHIEHIKTGTANILFTDDIMWM